MQPENAESLISVTESLILNEFSLAQPENAASLIDVTAAPSMQGIMADKPEQPPSAPAPITSSGILIEVRPMHPENALTPQILED